MTKTLMNKYTLFKYMWVLVVLPKELQLISLLAVSIFINYKSIKRKDSIVFLFLIYIAIYFISIYINVNISDFDTKRILAAINTASIWIISLLMYIYYKNNYIDIKVVSKYCYNNIIILITFSLVSLILYNFLDLRSSQILGRDLFGIDWFNDKAELRFIGLLDYSNLVVLFYMIFFPFYSNYIIKNKSNISKYILILLSILPVLLTLSRSGYVVVLIASLLSLIYLINKKINKKLLLFIISIFLGIIIIIIAYSDVISVSKDVIINIINGREGSTSTRIEIYAESIRTTTLNSPIWGMGIKSISSTGYPLGSHSTYIGFYYKTGIIGLITGLSLILNTVFKMVSSKIKDNLYKVYTLYMITITLMLIFEDIDGANWLIVCYFSIVGILINRENWIPK